MSFHLIYFLKIVGNMASINAVIVPAKVLKGGKHKIRISIAHNSETRYLVTDIIVDSIKEFKNGIVVKRPDAAMLNVKIRGLLQKYQTTIDELGYTEGLTCAELVYQIKSTENSKHRTLNSVCNEYIANSRAKQRTKLTYETARNVLMEYISGNALIESVNHATIIGFDKHLHKKGLRNSTIRRYMAFFISMLKYSVRCGYAQFKIDPTLGYSLPQSQPRQSWLTVQEIKLIRDLQRAPKHLLKCRDLFMLSYYLGGINMIDLLKINFNEQVKTIKYVRTKTADIPKVNEYVEFDIPEEAKPIIDRMKGPDGRLAVTEFDRQTTCSPFFRRSFPELRNILGIPNLIYYSARKSFSQHAYTLGVPESVIDYILGHKVGKGGMLFNYVYVTPEMATQAVRKVLDNLK